MKHPKCKRCNQYFVNFTELKWHFKGAHTEEANGVEALIKDIKAKEQSLKGPAAEGMRGHKAGAEWD